MFRQNNNLRIIGIGASAGGLDALARFLPALPMPALLKPASTAFAQKTDANNVYVIAQHMAKDSRIDLVLRLLQRHSALTVVEAKSNDLLMAGKVYLIPPGVTGVIDRGRIQLLPISSEQISSPSVNALFNSIAQETRSQAIGIILSGAGSDGLAGCRALKAYGGKVIVQSPETAQHDGMPSAIISAGLADQVLSPEQIPASLFNVAAPLKTNTDAKKTEIKLSAQEAEIFNQLIHSLALVTGNDFSHYKEETLWRRLSRRMSMLKIVTLADYIIYLQKQPDELLQLQHQFLISLSSFFRDKESFSALKIHVHNMLLKKNCGDSIRIWIPGCASGEECYSWAILLLEVLGNRQADFAINVVGSDLNERAIAIAEQGIYPLSVLDDLKFANIHEYVDVQGHQVQVKPHIRQLCRFRIENIIGNHLPEKMDAISCRNLLIYLKSELQDELIRKFHDSLNSGGLLFLGQSETIGLIGNTLFSPLDHHHRVYCKKSR